MSYDLKLYRRCDHRLHKQRRDLDLSDKRSLRLRHFLGSTANLRVFLNGYEVPQGHSKFGWSVVQDEEQAVGEAVTSVSIEGTPSGCLGVVTRTLPLQIPRKILFDRVFKSIDDCIEVSYFSSLEHCPKCGASGTIFDYEYTQTGKLVTVINESKLVQEMEKIVVTILGSSIFYPWYGTSIVNLIGGKLAGTVTQSAISSEIAASLSALKKLQEKQQRYQEVSDREFLESIKLIDVSPLDTDPTYLKVTVVTQSQAGGEQVFSQDLRLDRSLFTTPLAEIRRAVI